MNESEMKYHDTSIATASRTPWTTVRSLCLIPEGLSESTRIGRRINITSIMLRWKVSRDNELSQGTPLGALAPITGILCIIHDRQANGAVATPSDIFQSPNNEFSFNKLSNAGRFTTVFRQSFRVPQGNLSADSVANKYTMSGGVIPSHTVVIPCDIPIDYSGTTGDIKELTSGNLLQVVYFSHELAGSINGLCRLRFTDE